MHYGQHWASTSANTNILRVFVTTYKVRQDIAVLWGFRAGEGGLRQQEDRQMSSPRHH